MRAGKPPLPSGVSRCVERERIARRQLLQTLDSLKLVAIPAFLAEAGVLVSAVTFLIVFIPKYPSSCPRCSPHSIHCARLPPMPSRGTAGKGGRKQRFGEKSDVMGVLSGERGSAHTVRATPTTTATARPHPILSNRVVGCKRHIGKPPIEPGGGIVPAPRAQLLTIAAEVVGVIPGE
jgi:hypothetical protein